MRRRNFGERRHSPPSAFHEGRGWLERPATHWRSRQSEPTQYVAATSNFLAA